MKPQIQALLLGISTAVALSGCATNHKIIASTGTNLGIDVSQDPATQSPKLRVGYNRAEAAIVPTNRQMDDTNGSRPITGAEETGEVIMEIRMEGGILFSGLQDAGLYQRLAVGKVAVQQPGAALMFAKADNGTISTDAADAVAAAVKSIPATPADVTKAQLPLARAYTALAASNKADFDAAAINEGYASFSNFLTGKPATASMAQIKAIRTELEKKPAIKSKIQEFDK